MKWNTHRDYYYWTFILIINYFVFFYLFSYLPDHKKMYPISGQTIDFKREINVKVPPTLQKKVKRDKEFENLASKQLKDRELIRQALELANNQQSSKNRNIKVGCN
jgi:hypothetical protein